MKKFAYLLAALSICAFSFNGCSDDDDNKNEAPAKAQVNEACQKNDDCANGLVCNDDKKCEKKADAGDADDACKDKEAGADCGDNKVCDDAHKCVDKPAESGQADEACKDKKENDACGDNKICDKDLKCVDKPADVEVEIKCEDLNGVKDAVKNLAKVDTKDCEKFLKAYTDMMTAMLTDKVFTENDSDEDAEAKTLAVLQKCAAGWGVDEAKREALSAAAETCGSDDSSSSEVKCDDLANTKKAVAAAAKVDPKKCDDLMQVSSSIISAMEKDGVTSKDDSAEVASEKRSNVLATCAEGWGMTQDKQQAFTEGLAKCAEEAGGNE